MEKAAFDLRYDTYRRAIETYLNGLFAGKPHWADLYESMRYSILAGTLFFQLLIPSEIECSGLTHIHPTR